MDQWEEDRRDLGDPTSDRPYRMFQLLRALSILPPFHKGFSDISVAPHAATTTLKEFKWTEDMEFSFVSLKSSLIALMLILFPEFDLPLVGFSYASARVTRGTRAEEGCRKVHRVQFTSRTMNSTEKNYSAGESEAVGLIVALKQFQVNLL